MTIETIILAGLLVIAIIMILMLSSKVGNLQKEVEGNRNNNDAIQREIKESRMETLSYMQNTLKAFGDMISTNQKDAALNQDKRLQELNDRFARLADDNNKSLEKMRDTVDEKLQKTLEDRIGQSFKLVSERLEQVYKGLGEMQTLATGVGDLKKVLSNVKTRGILGEIQLGAILEQILSPEQYEENVITKSTGSDRVEFAVKLPGEDDRQVYLPIDAKFPGDLYSRLMDAYDAGDTDAIEAAAKALERRIKDEAKDIHTKYVDPPYTTDFAIMFLPFEGLYAEVVRRGLVEQLQRDYKVNIAGPTTMAALLNSLQMGFKTLAIQKHSSEVWDILGAVKTEFGKFEVILKKAQDRINQANNDLDTLIGTRTNVIQRKLRGVTALGNEESLELLELDDMGDIE